MTENPKIAISPTFSLKDSIMNPQGVGDVLPVAVAAANRVMDGFNTDPKTGLMNEKSWRDSLRETIDNLDPVTEAVVYVADLDNFKIVNDTLGHEAGDELLGIVAEAFRISFKRSTDVVGHGSREQSDKESIARLGGDEFAVFSIKKASDASNHRTAELDTETVQQADRVNKTLEELLEGTRFAKFGIKLSIGSAERQLGETSEEVFARADLKMFEVKYASKIQQLSSEDKEQLKKIIPYLESKGARVESWLKQAVNLLERT